MSSPLVESFVIFQQYISLIRLFPSKFRFVFVKLGLIGLVASLCGLKFTIYMWMLARKLMCTNLFEEVEGGFLLWHQMGLGKMNHTFEKTQNKAVPADPSDPLLRKWVKVPENPIAKHPAEVVSNITFIDPIVVWQEDDGS